MAGSGIVPFFAYRGRMKRRQGRLCCQGFTQARQQSAQRMERTYWLSAELSPRRLSLLVGGVRRFSKMLKRMTLFFIPHFHCGQTPNEAFFDLGSLNEVVVSGPVFAGSACGTFLRHAGMAFENTGKIALRAKRKKAADFRNLAIRKAGAGFCLLHTWSWIKSASGIPVSFFKQNRKISRI